MSESVLNWFGFLNSEIKDSSRNFGFQFKNGKPNQLNKAMKLPQFDLACYYWLIDAAAARPCFELVFWFLLWINLRSKTTRTKQNLDF